MKWFLIPAAVIGLDAARLLAQAANPVDGWAQTASQLGAVGLMFWLLMHYVKVVVPRTEERMDRKDAEHRAERHMEQQANQTVLEELVESSKAIRATQVAHTDDLREIRKTWQQGRGTA